MSEENPSDSVYFSIADTTWERIDPQVREKLRKLYVTIGTCLAEADSTDEGANVQGRSLGPQSASGGFTGVVEVLSPAKLALEMHEVAGSILEASSPDEQGLRQIITTLRTALTVAFDFYGAQTAERITVAQHMRSLKEHIIGFEKDLSEIRARSRQGPTA